MVARHPPPSLSCLLLIPSIGSIIYSLSVHAYIPALPVNDTSGLNLTDSSSISISWTDPPSVYSGPVSYQLKADVPTGGTTAGALVHFSEATMGPNLTTATPWIAYISCDVNETLASEEWDIFTLARDRGAVSALLYTATSTSCLLNPEYIADFEKPLDVFATKTKQVARVIDNQWSHTNVSFYTYNGTLLNSSGTDVNQSLISNAPSYRIYLIGTLTARNSTGQATATGIPGVTSPAASTGGHHPPGSMIALYVITGIISLSFILMIFVGARRAMRHPERYGRREADDEQGPQSTAGGLAQAILDTFPVIKFNRSGHRGQGSNRATAKRISSEANIHSRMMPSERQTTSPQSHRRDSLAMRSLYTDDIDSYQAPLQTPGSSSSKTAFIDPDWSSGRSGIPHSRSRSLITSPESRRPSGTGLQDQALAEESTEGAGSEQCPICLVDFEEGEDLRVLPCEREHAYHQTCIDPWLLQVSGSCPLCRKDFNNPNPSTPANPTTSDPPSSTPSPTSTTHPIHPDPPTHSGFAKYLAFMRRERRAGGRPRAGTGTTTDSGVGQGRRREADQTGPGGY